MEMVNKWIPHNDWLKLTSMRSEKSNSKLQETNSHPHGLWLSPKEGYSRLCTRINLLSYPQLKRGGGGLGEIWYFKGEVLRLLWSAERVSKWAGGDSDTRYSYPKCIHRYIGNLIVVVLLVLSISLFILITIPNPTLPLPPKNIRTYLVWSFYTKCHPTILSIYKGYL